MSGPTSMKLGSPTPVNSRILKKYLILYLIIIFMSSIPLSLFEYYYYQFLWVPGLIPLFWIFLPINIVAAIYILLVCSILVSRLFLSIVNLIHKPKEGIFKRDLVDTDFKYWNIRNIIKKWPFYISATNPLPWLKNRFVLRFFGVKIGKHSACDQAWISSEFVSIGKNTICGISSAILSYGIEQDKFFLKKIVIGDNVVMGTKVVLMPGTQVGDNAKIFAHSYTTPGQVIEANKAYGGHPAKLIEKPE